MNAPLQARRVHVLQVVHGLTVGGTERVVADLALHFNDEHYLTSVCCLDDLGPIGQDLRQRGIPVHVLGRRPGVDLPLIWRLRRLYRTAGVDLVHAHQYTPYFYSAAACLATRHVRVVFTEHGRHQPDRLRIKRALFNRLLLRATSRCTAVSAFTRDSLVAFERIPARRIEVVYNGLEPRASGTSDDRVVTRRQLGIAVDTPLVLSVGRMDRIKDFATLIQAMRMVVARMPGALLLVAGDGDPMYASELTNLVATLGLRVNIRFLGSRDDVPSLLEASDVFALTSLSEATSMTVLEAMRAARAVVATDVGGNRELVVDGQTGRLVPARDAGAVATALLGLLNDPAKAGRMGAAAAARVATTFSSAQAFAAYARIYRGSLAA